MADKVRFTKEQEKAINFKDNSILVSAAAGSGKTTVMIERVARLVCDDHIPIKRFLIISFTKASASDMKNKLIKKLSSLEPTPFILAQLDDILTSDVSNLHSFCARLLKAYFFEVGLDPTFVVLDEDEVSSLKERALEKLFKAKSAENNADFYNLVDIFAKNRSLFALKEVILKLYDFLCSIVDRDGWKEKINDLYSTDLNKNPAVKIIDAHMKAEFYRCKEKVQKKIEEFAKIGETELVEYLQALDTIVSFINPKSDFLENASRLKEIPRMPTIPKLTPEKTVLKESATALKEEILKRYKELKKYAISDALDSIKDNLVVTKEVVQRLFDLTQEFEVEFSSLKKEKGGLDFNDLEQNTLKVLKNQDLLEEIRAKYDYVLVDEYQDINGVQEEILRLLSRPDNRFMVGDVKQSIYRFRLCDPEIFLEKYNLYGADKTKGELVLLNANFRSKSAILDFVNTIFSMSMTEEFGGVNYKDEACLVAGDEEKQVDTEKRVKILFADSKKQEKDDGELEVYSVMNDKQTEIELEKDGEAEGLMIAGQIADLVAHKKIFDKDLGRMREIRYSDITILTQSRNGFLTKLVETIEEQGIPVSTDTESDILEDEYIFGLKSFLESVANYKNDYSLFSCLFSKIFGFTANELAKIKLAGGGDYYYENVLSALKSGKLDEKLQKKLQDFFLLFDNARERSEYLSAREIAEEIVKKQDVLVRMSFEEAGEKRKQKLIKYLSSLGDKSVFEYIFEDEGGVKCEPEHTYGSVKVMTIHKSKGLEFGVVFLVMANKNFNLKSLRGDMLISKDLGVGLSFHETFARYKLPTIAKQGVKLVETRKLLEEQQRLLYVALTRATDYLYVVGSGSYESIKEELPTSPMCFVDYLGDMIKNPTKYASVNYDVLLFDADELIESKQKPEKRQVLINEFNDEKVEKIKEIFAEKYPFENSVGVPVKTAVTTISSEAAEEGEPQMFAFDEGDGSSAENGTLQHKFMEKLSLLENKEGLEKKVKELVEVGFLTKDEGENIMIDGISKLLENNEFALLVRNAKNIGKEVEFYMLLSAKENFGGCEGDGVVVQGIVDLCLEENGGLVIIDYKTGSLKNPATLERYRKQLALYAEAMEKSKHKKVMKKYLASLKTGNLIEV